MAQERTFTLIGNFTDNITPKIDNVNKSLNSMRRSMSSFSAKGSGFDSVTKSIGKVVAAHKKMTSEVKSLKSEVTQANKEIREYSRLLYSIGRSSTVYGNSLRRLSADYRTMAASARSAAAAEASMWRTQNQALQRYLTSYQRLQRMQGGGGGPGGPGAGGGRGGDRGGRRSVLGDVIGGSLITSAIISGFQQGMAFVQSGFATILGAFAERAKDQLEDIASAGGIFSAAKFGGAKGLPATLQGALEMQDSINKSMASIASALPGTTQDYVMNARRMTDTLAQVMSKDVKNFENLAKKLSGDISIQGEKAFEVVNVEVAKATTLLEKLNPTRTVVPMSQIVEDMMKSEKVTVAGLRRYVSFRRATTFEAALNRNLKDLNATGQGTADRLGAIIKVLKEAVPPELITAMTTSVSGVIEGFKSAVLDPDVGIFGLSRTLGLTVTKFNRETGKPVLDKLGKEIPETTNFFKLFSEIFGNLGNLLNSAILPGLAAIYHPFEGMAKTLVNLREYSYKVFALQQSYTKFYSDIAESMGMSTGAFKSGEKGAVGVILNVLENFGMIGEEQFKNITAIMKRRVSAKQVEIDMEQIYKTIIPAIFKSPVVTKFGSEMGRVLGTLLVEIASLIDSVLHGAALPASSAFIKSFEKAGGMKALNDIIIYIAEIIARVIIEVTKIMANSLLKALTSGNFAAAAALAAPLLMVPGARGLIGAGINSMRGGAGMAGAAGAAGGAGAAAGGGGGRALMGALFASQMRKAGKAGQLIPGVKTAGKVIRATGRVPQAAAFAAQAGTLMSRFVIPPAVFQGVTKFGKGIAAVGKNIPLLNVAFAGLDFALRKQEGQKTEVAAAGASGGLIGSIIGAGLGAATGPFAAIAIPAFSVAFGYLGSKMGEVLASSSFIPNAISVIGKWLSGASKTVSSVAESLVSKVKAGWNKLREIESFVITKLTNLENSIISASSKALAGLSSALKRFADWLLGLPAWWFGVLSKVLSSMLNVRDGITTKLSDPGTWMGLKDAAINGIRRVLSGSKNWIMNIGSGPKPESRAATPIGPPAPTGRRTGKSSYEGSLGDAIASEMKHKPSGSDLVIANSSETVIPAAGGYGMTNFVEYMRTMAQNTAISGNLLNDLKNLVNRQFPLFDTLISKSNSMITIMTSGAMKVKFMIGGTGGKGGPGAVDAFNPIASSYGLSITSAYRPGDPGYHGINRARDYSNSSGPTSQMHEFATFMAAAFGGDLAELIYTPLGFSIKNGQVVPPYAQANHYDHVHVAYALGAGSPAFFSSANAARNWERKMAPKYTSISTVTGNSAEGFGSSNNINANFNIYQQPGQDPKELAAMVAMELSMAVDSLRNH